MLCNETKTSINFISPDLWPPTALSPFAYNVCGVMKQRTPFRNADELKKRLVEVWSRTLSTLLSMNGESICVPVFAQRANISNILCNQLDNWTTDKLSAKVTEIWTKYALCVLF